MAPKEAIEKINALGIEIGVASTGSGDDYISLTDIARYKSDEPKMVVQNWMRNRNTIEFLGVWESLHNPDFKGIEFDAFREEAGLNSFTLTPTKWISRTNAIGIRTKRGEVCERHVRPQGHRIRVRFVDFPGVQALRHQRLPASEERREQ